MSKKSITIAVAVCILILWLSHCSAGMYNKAIENLYQQAQEEHRAEFARRQANIKKLETIELQSSLDYQVKIEQIAAAVDNKIKALKWKTNRELLAAKASAEDILGEKAMVETALGEMTANRDGLIVAAYGREKEIDSERLVLKNEYAGALKAKQDELNLCEKAREWAVGEAGRKTWITIGPAVMAHIQAAVVRVSYGVSIQIPLIEIKSPFKRF